MRRHRWTRAEWSGLDPDLFRDCELLEGEIVDMSPMGNRHAMVTDEVHTLFVLALRHLGLACGSQTPIILDDHSEPAPDVWVANIARRALEHGKPQPHELQLVVEVADSSARTDRRMKLPMYAAASIPAAWMIDLTENAIDVYSAPDAASRSYQFHERFAASDRIDTPWGESFAVAALLIVD
jgi:Uma2 family endonuclease